LSKKTFELISEIRNHKGITYDAAVVKACLELFEKKEFKWQGKGEITEKKRRV